jgi:hypothetical protein
VNVAADFYLVRRPTGDCWAHLTLPVWVVEYPKTEDRPTFFQAYIATGKLIKGQHPCLGGVDNKRIGNERNGFRTAEEAMAAAVVHT